jgi:hypothetical protein
VIGIATGCGLDGGGVGVRVLAGSRIFSKLSRPALESTQPPIRWIPGALSPGVKRPGREVPRSRKRGSIHLPPIHLDGVVLNSLSTGTNLPLLLYLVG